MILLVLKPEPARKFFKVMVDFCAQLFIMRPSEPF